MDTTSSKSPKIIRVYNLSRLPKLVVLRLSSDPPDQGVVYEFIPDTGYGDRPPAPMYFVEVDGGHYG
jgi:hypothetical protein